MNNRFFQQAEQLFKPMADIAALNAKTLEALAEKQTGLMSEVWTDGMNYARNISEKRDVESLYTSQKDFWENMSQKFSTTAQDSFAVLTEAQGKMTELMQDSIASVDFASMADTFSENAEQAARATQSQAQRAANAAESTAKSTAKTAKKSKTQTAKKSS
jgi:hypothetical protein